MSITQPERERARECVCVFVASGIQHAARMRHVAICALPRSTVFSHIISQRHDFLETVIEHKMCFDFLYTFYLKHFSF